MIVLAVAASPHGRIFKIPAAIGRKNRHTMQALSPEITKPADPAAKKTLRTFVLAADILIVFQRINAFPAIRGKVWRRYAARIFIIKLSISADSCKK